MILANFRAIPGVGDDPALGHRCCRASRFGFTLVEMLVAISITLVMMATVVGVFATVSGSVQNRRAAIEAGGQLRHVRNVLQRDLEGATCPTLPWTRPESNVGYFEIVEGLHSDFYPSDLTDAAIGGATTSIPAPGGKIDHAISTLPSSNLPMQPGWVTDGGGLGDYDDILAFTSRNETEPFSGPGPQNNVDASNNQNVFSVWQAQSIKSPVAEVVWFCVENPAADTGGYFGNESLAGFRTLYRRTLLVAPWLDFKYDVAGSGAKSRPGVLRILNLEDPNDDVARALAALIAFQERYDISARIEFDPTIDADGRWIIKANTLADLTDRKNRYEHHGFVGDANSGSRMFPFVMASAGGQPYSNVQFVPDPSYTAPGTGAQASPIAGSHPALEPVAGFTIRNRGSQYLTRPLAVLQGGATARAIRNDAGEVVHVTSGLVPLGSTSLRTSRRGEDLMMSDTLAFDVRVFDPAAPVYALRPNGVALREGDSDAGDPQLDLTAVGPGSLGWGTALADGNQAIVSQGAYVDLGYRELFREVARRRTGSLPRLDVPVTPFAGLPNAKSLLNDARLTRVYDTWNFAYENDGLNQDRDQILNGGWSNFGTGNPSGQQMVDEGTDGFDSFGEYADAQGVMRLGTDDPGERETSPPYPEPLRAVQITLRVYEPDSRQMREVTVRQHFVPE